MMEGGAVGKVEEDDKSFVGIDLGCSKILVAYMQPSVRKWPKVFMFDDLASIPNVVTFKGNNQFVTGVDALLEMKHEEFKKRTIYDVKRVIGRCRHQLEILKSGHYLFDWNVDEEGQVKYVIPVEDEKNGHVISFKSPEEVLTCALQDLKTKLDDQHEMDDVDCVAITVPSCYKEAQRRAIIRSSSDAGYTQVKLISNTSAIALQYANRTILRAFEKPKQPVQVMTLNFGATSFEVAILAIDARSQTTLACNGDSTLGGAEIDSKIFEYIWPKIISKVSLEIAQEITNSKSFKAAILSECKIAKEVLVGRTYSKVIPMPIALPTEAESLTIELTYKELEAITSEMHEQVEELILKTIGEAEAKLNRSLRLDAIIPTGGSTGIRWMKDILRDENQKKNKRPAMTLAAEGAAIYSALIYGGLYPDFSVREICHSTMWLMITNVDQDGVVAIASDVLIPRNTPIPCSANREMEVEPGSELYLKVYEGESVNAEECTLVGAFRLNGVSETESQKLQFNFKYSDQGTFLLDVVDARNEKSGSLDLRDYDVGVKEFSVNLNGD